MLVSHTDTMAMNSSSVTELMEMNLTTMGQGADNTPAPLWSQVFDNVQVAITIIGLLANVATIVTLTVNGQDFSEIIKMLLIYQSVLDGLICLVACFLFKITPMAMTGYKILDIVICQAWHSQYIYWVLVAISINNLVTLALERYLCVCHPLKYQSATKRHFLIVMLAFFIYTNFIAGSLPLQVRYADGKCLSEYYWSDKFTAQYFSVYGVLTFFLVYFIPCASLIILYGLIIISFRIRAKKNLGASGSSNVIDTASNQLTKTAIVVTLIFIVAIGFDLWYYMLAYIGLTSYIINSPIQKVSVFFSVMNSVINPFVYTALMPLYRKSVKKTFFKHCTT